MPQRQLSKAQKAARRERAKLRRQATRDSTPKPKPKTKPKQRAKLKAAKVQRQQIEEGKKRVKRAMKSAVVWKCEMVTAEGGVQYGPMWVKGHRIGKAGGRWIAKDMAQDLARVLELKFKEV